MRIGIDARELGGHPTGVGRYLSGLLAQWLAAPGAAHEFVLYSHQPLTAPAGTRPVEARFIPGAGGSWWEQVSLPTAMRQDRLDVLFSPGYTTPLATSVPTVVAIHDLSFAVHPEWFSPREGLRRRWLTSRAAQAARAVVTISKFTASELEAVYGLPSARVHVVPPGITTPPSHAIGRDTMARVLYAGSIFNRRHVPDLIDAFVPLARHHQEACLEIVGDNRSRPYQNLTAQIEATGLRGQIRWRRWLPDEELGALYGSARAFAFLSTYEGLGLTPLEALSAGVPPVLLDTAVARESCGDAALYVPHGNRKAVTVALERLLFDAGVRQQLLAAAPSVLARYDWPDAAARTLDVLERAGR